MSMALTACSTSGGDKKTSTNSSSGGDSKSEEKLAAKQVLNRTETNEIPTMDTIYKIAGFISIDKAKLSCKSSRSDI